MSREDVEKVALASPFDAPKKITTQSLKSYEENKTMNRRTVTVELFDDDKGLPVEKALVASFENVVTEDDDETTIREILMNKDIAKTLEKHNEKRKCIVNEEILQRTGNEVNLNEVKLKSLRWVVK